MPQLTTLEQGTVVHRIPGRVRLRLPRLERDAAYGVDLQRAIATLSGIKDIRVNPAASSIIITYLPQQLTEQRLLEQMMSVDSGFAIAAPTPVPLAAAELDVEPEPDASLAESLKEELGEEVGGQFGEQVGELVGGSIGAFLGVEGANLGTELGAKFGGSLGGKFGGAAAHETAKKPHHESINFVEEAEEVVAELAGAGAGEVIGEVVGGLVGEVLLGPAGAVLGAEVGAALGEEAGGIVGEDIEHSLQESAHHRQESQEGAASELASPFPSLISPQHFPAPSSPRSPIKLGVMASGSGSNFEAIAQAIADQKLTAKVQVVVYNNPAAKVKERAERWGIPAVLLNHREFASREALDEAIVKTMQQSEVDYVIMAGWMRIVTAVLIDAFPDRVLNIHPSLLPSFKGAHAVEEALKAGVKITGCTVHLVRLEVDSGPILVQAAVPVLPDDTAEKLQARIQVQEHRIYPQAIGILGDRGF